MFASLPQFYNSDEWRSFRRQIINERTNPSDGVLYDQHSGEPYPITFVKNPDYKGD